MILIEPGQIKKFREARGLSRTRLSRLAGLSSNYVSRVECGQITDPSGSKMNKIMMVLQNTPVIQSPLDELSQTKLELSE